MQAIDFCENWAFCKKGGTPVPVRLPHDAMIHEKREPDAPGGSGSGYFPGGCYEYRKTLYAPPEWKTKSVYLNFDGVYRNAAVFVNGEKCLTHHNGYTPFLLPLDAHLHYNAENEILVVADNSKLPNSRWYSGSEVTERFGIRTLAWSEKGFFVNGKSAS